MKALKIAYYVYAVLVTIGLIGFISDGTSDIYTFIAVAFTWLGSYLFENK